MNLIKSFLTKNDCYQNNVKRIDSRYKTFQDKGATGLMLHSVGCEQPSAKVFINTWNKPASQQGGRQTCVHAFVEANGDVYQTMPWNYRGWHGGGKSNDTYIGVEMTEPDTIKYEKNSSKWTDLDPTKTKAHVLGTYKASVELFATLCQELKLDPLRDGVVISHSEGYKRGIASNSADVEHIWSKFGLTMNQFRKDVSEKMKPGNNIVPPASPIPHNENWAQEHLDNLVGKGIIQTPDAWKDFKSNVTKEMLLALIDKMSNK